MKTKLPNVNPSCVKTKSYKMLTSFPLSLPNSLSAWVYKICDAAPISQSNTLERRQENTLRSKIPSKRTNRNLLLTNAEGFPQLPFIKANDDLIPYTRHRRSHNPESSQLFQRRRVLSDVPLLEINIQRTKELLRDMAEMSSGLSVDYRSQIQFFTS